MKTLSALLYTMGISELLAFADKLDVNNSWRDSLEDDTSITRHDLINGMLSAYDDEDTHAWINK